MFKIESQHKKDWDDLQQVMFHVRHSCGRIKKLSRAVAVICSKTNLSEERVVEVLNHIFGTRFEIIGEGNE